MDKELAKIITRVLKDPSPNPKCPKCGIEGVIKGYGELAWCACPKCGQRLGELTVM